MSFSTFFSHSYQASVRFLRWLLRDWPWKLVALGIGLFLFFSIRQTVSHTQTLSLMVEADLTDGAHALRGFSPAAVRVTFRGSESEIRRLSLRGSEPPRVTVRLQQPPAGQTQVPVTLTRRNVLVDGDLHIVSVEPAQVVAEYDTSETRYFNVETPLVHGETETTKFSVTLDPGYVEVTGPRERLDELVEQSIELPTEPIEAIGRTEDFSVVLRVQPPDSRSSWTVSPATVRADVKVLRDASKRDFDRVGVRVLQSAEGQTYQLKPETIKLTIEGVKEELDAILAESLLAVVEPPQIANTTEQDDAPIYVKPNLIFPYNRRVKSIEMTPSVVQLIPDKPREQPKGAQEDVSPVAESTNETSERSDVK